MLLLDIMMVMVNTEIQDMVMLLFHNQDHQDTMADQEKMELQEEMENQVCLGKMVE